MPMKQMKRQQQMIPSNFEQMIQRNKRETLMNSFNVVCYFIKKQNFNIFFSLT